METGIEIKNADSVVYFMTDGIRILKMKRLPGPGPSIELAGAVDTDKTVDMASSSKQTGLRPQLFETSERKGSKEDVKIEMCRNLSWHRAFFTNDGLLDAEELASMTEGDGRDVKHQLQGIEEKLCRSMDSISTLGSDKTLEAKLFEKMEASIQKSSGSSKLTNSSIKRSSGEGDSKAKPSRFSPKGTKAATTQASKVTGPDRGAPISLSPLGSSTPIKTEATRSSPLGGATSGTSKGDNVKSSARRSTSSKTGKATADSTSKTPPGIRAKNKVSQLLPSKLSPRTSPTNSGSSSSTSDVNQRSSRGSSASCRSFVNNEKSSATNARRKDEQSIGKTPSSISFKNKPPPVNSSSPLGLSNSSPSKSPASFISQRPSESSSSISTVDQSSRSRGSRGTSVHNRPLNRDASAKSTLKNHPTPDRRGKQPAALHPQTGSISQPHVQSMGGGIPSTKSGFINEGRSYKSCLLTGLRENDGTQSKNGSSNVAKSTKVPPPRTVAAAHTGLKSNSQKTRTTPPNPSSQKQQSSGKAKASITSASRAVKTLVLTSPEVLDIKGKLNALRMEISNQKQDKYKDIKMAPAGSGKGKSTHQQN
ncbi:uncharacterized protein DDB_G0280205-like [Cynara cardunculus var. scolymus]|uniref:uncharacterized protein DDB_G0280205-like n=1 Tax=Cynara cardunculus var. scolymus TaxID=59895 RepID=UPI000D62C386|nr:uncharacterized protein DDB_G0280205-like [Cynara cardunculus var. scolymus]